MSGVGFKLPANSVFFNSKEVISSVEKAERQVLSRFGYLTTKDAKSSMRRRKKGPSEPGKAPRVVKGLLKEYLFYVWDRFKQTVVIGPARLTGFEGAGEALPALEYGNANIEARPFMNPAFERQLDEHMPGLWKDSIS